MGSTDQDPPPAPRPLPWKRPPPFPWYVNYGVLTTVNLLAHVPAAGVFFLGFSRDGYAALYATLIGVPLVLGQTLFGLVPTLLLLRSRDRGENLWARRALAAAAVLPLLLAGAGLALTWFVTTHTRVC